MSKSLFDTLLVRPIQSLPAVGYEKVADQGQESPDQGQLEQDFARLAYMFLQDRAAGLIKYLLGFEVVNREEDGSKAVGIFGFKIAKEYYYVPAFFLNNQIKGIDLLYSKRTNMFVPLQEDWINYIINRQTIELGQGSNVNDIQRHFENPNFNFIAQPPQSSKIGSAVTDQIHDSFDTWNKMQDWTAQQFEKDAELQTAWAGFVSRYVGDNLPFEKTADNSQLIHFLQHKGGPKAVSSLMGAMTDLKFANAALTFYPDVASLYVSDFSTELAPKTASSRISIVSEDCGDCAKLDTDQKKRLVRDGFAINDDRKDEERSEVYETDYTQRFSTPDRSGLYDVLLASGRTTKAWVLLPSEAAKCGYAMVIETDKRIYRKAEPNAVYVRDATTELKDSDLLGGVYDKAVELDKMEIGTEYCLVSPKGNCTGPVRVRSVIAEAGERVRLRVNFAGDYDIVKAPTYGHDFEKLHSRGSCPEVGGCSDFSYIELASHKGTCQISGTDTLVVPSDWKALKLYESDDYEKERALKDAFQLGSLLDIDLEMQKKGYVKLAVCSDDKGVEYYLRFNDSFCTRPMNYKAAYCTLVGRYGISIPDTELMLKEAVENFKSRRIVKLAQQSPMVGVSMPYPQERAPDMEPYTGLPVYGPDEQAVQGTMTGVPPPPQPNQYGVNLGGEAAMDTQAMQLAEQAGQTGQKHIFDHASIGGLSKVYDTSAVIDSYVPEMMKALDRVGRIIFMFYWKNEDFAERYGTNDMVEMEDLIRGVFKSFGELVLKLRKKAIGNEDSATM